MIYLDKEFGEIKILQSRRKTISIGINTVDETITIKSQQALTKSEIAELIERHRNWLRTKLDKIRKFSAYKHSFCEGDQFMYLGKLYPLEFGDEVLFSGSSFRVKFGTPPEMVKVELEKIYRELAKNYLSCHLKFTANKFKINYNKMRITSASSRWGSCTSQGNINFPWNLIMCPEELIDYVVCHELAHRLQMNHSAAFWQEVARLCPNYRVFRKLLKENSLKYSIF